MIDISYYQKIQNCYGVSDVRDAQKYSIKMDLNRDFSKTLDCYNVMINGKSQDLTILKTTSLVIKKIKSRPSETFNLGDIVEWQNAFWLVTDIDNNDDVVTYGKITRCNYLLKWQDLQGNIVERHIISSNASTYNSGESENKTLTLGTDQLMLLIPCDDETIKLRRGKRFFIDNNTENPMAYELTRPDTTTYFRNGHGYISCIVTESQVNTTTDRPDLMICDYFTPSPTPPTPTPVTTYSKITYKSLPEIKLGGNAKSFTVTFYDENNNVLTNLTPKWQIKSDFDGVILTSTSNPNVVSLKVSGSNNLIGKTFTLQVSDTDDENVSELVITIVSLI